MLNYLFYEIFSKHTYFIFMNIYNNLFKPNQLYYNVLDKTILTSDNFEKRIKHGAICESVQLSF